MPLSLPAGSLVVLVGASGSGKTTFASRFPDSWRISLDQLRRMATDNTADQSATPVARQIQHLLLEERLARQLTTIADSTNVLPHLRRELLAQARYWQVPAIAVLFTTPRTLCETRNAARDSQTPTPINVLRAQHTQLPTLDQLKAEGFDEVHVQN